MLSKSFLGAPPSLLLIHVARSLLVWLSAIYGVLESAFSRICVPHASHDRVSNGESVLARLPVGACMLRKMLNFKCSLSLTKYPD